METTRPRSSAYTFGLSRESCNKRYLEGHFISDPSVPGPGTYKIESRIGAEGSKYSFRPKTTTIGKFY